MKKLLSVLVLIGLLTISPAKADGLDQSNSTGGVSIGFGQAAGIKYSCQGFKPTFNRVTAVSFKLQSVGTAGMLVWLDNANSNSIPTGTVEVGLGSMEIASSTLSNTLKKYSFASSISVVPGNQYVFCMAPRNTVTHTYTDSYRNLDSSVSNPYANGKMSHYSGGTWSNSDSGNGDRVFEVYGEDLFFPTWDIQSVDMMKQSKDNLCSQASTSTIDTLVTRAADLGANYVAVAGFYDNPSCADATQYLAKWVSIVRSHNLKVWFRMKDLSFEGDYSTTKNLSPDNMRHQKLYVDWILANNLVQNGDIFTPNAEPQNGGIYGVSGGFTLANSQFASKEDFNLWLRQTQTMVDLAFKAKGLTSVKVGYWGFDGFITAGLGNSYWEGQSQLETSTIALMGNVAIDHYPQTGHTMSGDLPIIKTAIGSSTPIIISEFGAINSASSTVASADITNYMNAAANEPNVDGFNYWHMGPGGNESLLNSDLTIRSLYNSVKAFYLHP